MQNVFGAAIAVLLTFLAPISIYIFVMLLFVACDFITGVRAAQKRKELVQSKRMRDSVDKFIYYALAIVLSHALDMTLFNGVVNITYTVGGFILMIEFKSNLENISSITGISLWEFVKEKLASWFKKPTDEK